MAKPEYKSNIHAWCLLRTQVQPNPGWGTLCESCVFRFKKLEGEDHPCKKWGTSSKIQSNLLRYSNTGRDVRVSEIINKDFVEICALFSEDPN